ncbi:DMT family transporter [Thorsellia anophelis]|uniref:EamA-like transporter family protein n=1 Tax=Thorsellia anophelis DSM 18579 TaxID=1123402 RepID=A0A1I0DVJ7_9GAMM|nr:DMT family transporter [Thorsellia anophelis]SET36680.1 EamA-like transporter family protein [Thorsellia anophelis DSM 18579]
MKTNLISVRYQGVLFIILAGCVFAAVNAITPYISMTFSLNSGWIAFYQYFFALIAMLPWVVKSNILKHFHTHFFWRHFWRVMLAVVGVHFWVRALTVPIPIGQGLSLLMLSPFFVILGAVIFLKERISSKRFLALLTGFLGALIILNPWAEEFSYVMLFPLLAAFFFACHTIMLKDITDTDGAFTIVLYLYVLILPFNLMLAITDNLTTFNDLHFMIPNLNALFWLGVLGLLTAVGQWSLAKAYSFADASYIQPFDYVKLPINLLLGFLIFGWGISWLFFIGASLILLASIYITFSDKPLSKN